jgi:hypothetical protein
VEGVARSVRRDKGRGGTVTRFSVEVEINCPSDWDMEKVKQHLRKILTEKEVAETRIRQVFTAEECYAPRPR